MVVAAAVAMVLGPCSHLGGLGSRERENQRVLDKP